MEINIYELLDQIVEREAGEKEERVHIFPRGGKAVNKNVETFIKHKFDMQKKRGREK